jgi:hypothetical protein
MKNDYVVVDPVLVIYLTDFNQGDPAQSTFGNLQDAVIFDTLEAAQSAAARIGGGTVGTTKP